MRTTRADDRRFRRATPSDGRPLLLFVGLALVLAGLVALLLGISGRFLPHDERFLGVTARQLCALHGIHPAVGYDDPVHLAPALFGAALYLTGLLLTFPPRRRGAAVIGREISGQGPSAAGWPRSLLWSTCTIWSTTSTRRSRTATGRCSPGGSIHTSRKRE